MLGIPVGTSSGFKQQREFVGFRLVVEESEAVVVAESVVPDIEDPFVYLEKDGEIG